MHVDDAKMLSENAPSPKLIVAKDIQSAHEWVSTLYETEYLNAIIEAEVDTGSVRPELVAAANRQKRKAEAELHDGRTVLGVK